ncbi:MAG: dihydroorotase [FCB group bacterium]|nr:dihydroorotase [FCB group bacterium]
MSIYTLCGGHIIDPQTDTDIIADIQIEEGVITKIGGKLSGGEVIDLKGKGIIPGLVDMHVHLREPGREDTETGFSGCQAAAAGGFTGVACMPNTQPAIDTASVVKFILDSAKNLPVDVHPIAAITTGRKGERLSEMGELLSSGAVGFSDDGSPLMNTDLMRRALEYASDFNAVIIQHSEDPYLFKGCMHEGIVSTKLGLPGIPSLCEELMVERDVRLVEYTGGRLHTAHVSSKGTVEIIRNAKRKGLNVTAEVTPHHLFLTDNSVMGYNSNFKMNPPLRTEEDRQALIEGFLDGAIDCIATDHAPHAFEDKETDFGSAPFGVIGLETALGLILNEFVLKNKMNWADMIDRMSVKPRAILNLPEMKIAEGERANLTIIDPEVEWEVNPAEFKSKSRNTPFTGMHLKGRAYGIFNKGQFVINT